MISTNVITISQAAKIHGTTTQALRVAIGKGRLPSKLVDGKRRIEMSDLMHYRASKWSKHKHFEAGEVPPAIAAEIIGCPRQHVYHLMRIGRLPYYCKMRKTFAIKDTDVMAVKAEWVAKQISKKAKRAKK